MRPDRNPAARLPMPAEQRGTIYRTRTAGYGIRYQDETVSAAAAAGSRQERRTSMVRA